jgi:hypothetical protein
MSRSDKLSKQTLKISGKNLDDHTGFAGAGQFTGWNDDSCTLSDLMKPSSESENLWVISPAVLSRQALAMSESVSRRRAVFGSGFGVQPYCLTKLPRLKAGEVSL